MWKLFANGYRESHFFARHVGACVSTHTLTLSPEDVDPESVEQRYRTTVAPAASASMRQVSSPLEPCREIRLIRRKQTCIFSGSSHPGLVEAVCERLGQKQAKVALKKFSNGETSVEIRSLLTKHLRATQLTALQRHLCETKMSSSCRAAAASMWPSERPHMATD